MTLINRHEINLKIPAFIRHCIFTLIFMILSGMNYVHAQGSLDVLEISLDLYASGLSQPVHITNAGDGSNRLFIVEQTGRIRIMKDNSLLVTPFLDITGKVSCCGEQGLLSTAFPPDYEIKNYFYVHYTNLSGNTVIARYQRTINPDIADAGSEEIIMRIDQPFANHNGGQIVFGTDGYFYIGMGDGGSGGDPQNNAQNPDSLLGKMLRIDVESGIAPYAIPSDNPFTQNPDVLDEIWALGLRNPWRFSFDRITGDLFIGDVGQSSFEEIDFQPASSSGGENYGWRIMEGLHCFNPSTGCSQSGLTLPVTEYAHTEGCSVTGGMVYRGHRDALMQGVYFYGDYCSGRIWGLQRNGGQWQEKQLLDSITSITSFGEDESGELFVADYSTGDIYSLQCTAPFLDVPEGFWAENAINAIFCNSITVGCSSSPPQYCPYGIVTRNQMAAFLVRAMEGEPSEDYCGISDPFNDVSHNDWSCPYVKRLAELGITLGCGDNNFCPLENVTREQMAVFIQRAFLPEY
jgi:glucose/arabinose dehydrogenase